MSGLAKALKKILDSETEQDFQEIFDRLPEKIKKDLDAAEFAQVLEHHLLQAGNTEQAVNRAAKNVVNRKSLFANCAFRIQLTATEMDNRQLIIGHRLQPYIHPGISVEELRFFDDQDRPLPIIRSELPVNQDTSIFFNLLPPYGLTQYIEGDGTSQSLNMALIDLADWMTSQNFTKDDQILISAKNYAELEFYFEKVSSRDIASLRFADRHYDKQLTKAIYHVLALIGKSFLPVDMHLFWAIAQMEPGLIKKGGPPFGPFISQHESLTFYQEGPYAFLQDHNFIDELMENAFQYAKQSTTAEMGVASDLNGIFQELGNSFSRLLLKSLMVEQFLEWDEFREEELFYQMFEQEKNPFYNPEQEKKFRRAFTKLLRSVQQQWADRQLALPHLQLLRKAIHFKMDIIYLLRSLNKINDPNQLNMQALLQLQPIDQSLDQILENILSKKPMSYQEAQALVRQLDSGREKFLHFRDDLLIDF